MKKVKYLILGGGPSGLTLAHSLIDRGVPQDQVVLLEKEPTVGGLCRSQQVDGAPLDIGGGHFLDVRKTDVLDFLFRFMPREEWNSFDRISRIRLRGQEIDHPLESNLWQFSKSDQVDYLESIARSGCIRGEPMPEKFADWVTWKLGDRIAEEYMLPYNRKIWSMDPAKLGTYWLHKLPDVSFRETLRSCLEGSPFGALPAHGTFLYPKNHGYGEVWRRMGDALGDSLVTDCPVQSIDLATRTVNDHWQAETIISTIPWTLWPGFCDIPREVSKAIKQLSVVAIDVEYVPETMSNPSHWIYEPDEAISHHRYLLRSNFCTNARGYWTETNAIRSRPTTGFRHHNEFAYPVNTLGKLEAVAHVLAWAAGNGVLGIGRWGKWEHMNSDIAVAEAMGEAARITSEITNK
ncbi:MAG: NAD(P)-binding protein [Betaproteobacteria bacterium]|nr:NAD(P)-binding protein [Betaproteobacteria bacterium]